MVLIWEVVLSWADINDLQLQVNHQSLIALKADLKPNATLERPQTLQHCYVQHQHLGHHLTWLWVKSDLGLGLCLGPLWSAGQHCPWNLPPPPSMDWSAKNWTLEYYNMVSLEIRFLSFHDNPGLQVLLFHWLLITIVVHLFSKFSKIFCKDGMPCYLLSLNLRISRTLGAKQNRERKKRSI